MRVLVKSDTPNWALQRRAEAYAAYPPPGWDVQIANSGWDRTDEDWNAVFLLDCHATPTIYGDVRYARLMASHCWLHDRDPNDFRTRGCNESRCRSKRQRVFGRAHAVAVYNKEQMGCTMRQRLVLAPYCPDLKIFNAAGRPATGPKLRVGWCYQVAGGLNSFKGLSDVLVPLIALVGDSVIWNVLTPEASSAMNTADTVAWYRQQDIFLCTSSAEGGPQGPFEAAACGCVVISTDVGQVSDWDALRSMQLIVPTYRDSAEAYQSAHQMAGLIRALDKDRGLLAACRGRLIEDVKERWDAEKACPAQLQEIFQA